MPVQVLGGQSFADVCTGERHSCGLEPSGKAWCWGESNAGRPLLGIGLKATTPTIEQVSDF